LHHVYRRKQNSSPPPSNSTLLIIGKCNRRRQSGDGILSRGVLKKKVLKRRGPFNTGVEGFEVPKIPEGAENRRGAV
jgi:hypothetical protein